MLIRLTDLPRTRDSFECRSGQIVAIRRAMTYEQGHVIAWIAKTFSPAWADESKTAFGTHPVGCFIAVSGKGQLVGFCCYDATLRGFAGPIGVMKDWRGAGIGRALLISVLHAMKAIGYGYCVIGNVASPAFFEKAGGASLIKTGKTEIYPQKLVQ